MERARNEEVPTPSSLAVPKVAGREQPPRNRSKRARARDLLRTGSRALFEGGWMPCARGRSNRKQQRNRKKNTELLPVKFTITLTTPTGVPPTDGAAAAESERASASERELQSKPPPKRRPRWTSVNICVHFCLVPLLMEDPRLWIEERNHRRRRRRQRREERCFPFLRWPAWILRGCVVE